MRTKRYGIKICAVAVGAISLIASGVASYAQTRIESKHTTRTFTSTGMTSGYRGYVSTAPAPVRLAGEEVFTITSPAGGFTAEERSIIIERNLNNALIGSKDRGPSSVEVVTINRLPVIRVGGKHVLTVDTNLALSHNTGCMQLAQEWAANMRKALTDTARVNSYVAQLSGDYLYQPYSPPFRRAQWQAARMNHASFETRYDLPPDLVSSASVRDDGFETMLKRNPVAAEALFRQAIAMEPGNERAHYGLGAALLKQGRVEGAIPELNYARWLDPDDAQVHMALGQAMESKGLDDMALVRYREASLLHPEDPAPFLYIADLRETRDDIGRSAIELSQAAKNLPQSEYIKLRRQDQIGWRLTRPY